MDTILRLIDFSSNATEKVVMILYMIVVCSLALFVIIKISNMASCDTKILARVISSHRGLSPIHRVEDGGFRLFGMTISKTNEPLYYNKYEIEYKNRKYKVKSKRGRIKPNNTDDYIELLINPNNPKIIFDGTPAVKNMTIIMLIVLLLVISLFGAVGIYGILSIISI